jgi:hypothetical protein
MDNYCTILCVKNLFGTTFINTGTLTGTPKLYIEKKCCQKMFAAGDGVASRDQEAVQ